MTSYYRELTQVDNEYPANLKTIAGAPLKLYIRGSITKKDSFAVAIVGSRQMSKVGEKTAWEYATILAANNITIVSGLARGIDTVAHTAALKAHGRTLAVLGSGFNNFYPPENKIIANKIEENGAVITEFEPNIKPWGKNFLIRNRIIAGLSLCVVIIEGKRRSGTLSTAAHAANFGREVFVVPGSELTNYLIEEGATVANSPQDVLNFVESILDS